jgi:hypothetical protein
MGHVANRTTLIVLQVFVAFTAILGAIFVVPTLPLDWIKAGPMTDFTIPAVALGLCGLAAAVAVVLLVVDPRLGGAASVVAGALMIAFELVEIAVVGFALTVHGADQPQSWLQIVYIAIGAIGMVLGYRLWDALSHPRAMAHRAHPAH